MDSQRKTRTIATVIWWISIVAFCVFLHFANLTFLQSDLAMKGFLLYAFAYGIVLCLCDNENDFVDFAGGGSFVLGILAAMIGFYFFA